MFHLKSTQALHVTFHCNLMQVEMSLIGHLKEVLKRERAESTQTDHRGKNSSAADP